MDDDATWVPGAAGSGFGRANLPYGIVRGRAAVRVGDFALDLHALNGERALGDLPEHVFAGPTLNPFLALGARAWAGVRERLRALLAPGAPERPLPALGEPALPVAVGDYVDFFSSLEHATNVGRMFRPEGEPLTPNWRHLPIGYHGRAGTIVPSGTPIRRPAGQRPAFGPTEQLDVELELGFLTGAASAPVDVARAAEHVFGFVLVNDWSARDVQRWESRPLGPFLGKSFATSMSPWIVPLAALRHALVPARAQEPEPLPYLRAAGDWALDLELEIELDGEVISRVNARGLYWTFPQQLAHATVNGAPARPGDLYASGTISGPVPGSEGSLLERFGGERFLGDGDTVVLRGRTAAPPAVSLGELRGTVIAA